MTQRYAVLIAGDFNVSTDIRKSVHCKQRTMNYSYWSLNLRINVKAREVSHTHTHGASFSAVHILFA
jgi:hypothetical protein